MVRCNDINRFLHLFQMDRDLGLNAIMSVDNIELLEQIRDALGNLEQCTVLIKDRIKYLKKCKAAMVHNEPIEQLLAKLEDDKVDKDAIRQIKARFIGLDYKHQVYVMEKLLGKSASYRKWCYMMLLNWREPMFDDTLLDLWKKYREPGCRRDIVRLLPENKVRLIVDDLVDGIKRRDYFTLIRRFGMYEWFKINKDMFSQMCGVPDQVSSSKYGTQYGEIRVNYFYLWGMSLCHEGLPKSDCGKILYQFLKSSLELILTNENIKAIQKDYLMRIMWGRDFCSLMDLQIGTNPSLKDHLTCLFRMGYYDMVEGIVSWVHLPNKYIFDLLNSESGKGRVLLDTDEYLSEYCQKALDTLPINFEGIEDTPKYSETDLEKDIRKPLSSVVSPNVAQPVVDEFRGSDNLPF